MNFYVRFFFLISTFTFSSKTIEARSSSNPFVIEAQTTSSLLKENSSLANSPTFKLADPIKHKTDFLTVGLSNNHRCFTHVYPGLSTEERQKCIADLKAKNYTHIYLYIYNEEDYGGPSFDFYNKPEEYILILKELIANGLSPVVWLVPDDAPNLHASSLNMMKRRFSKVISKIDPYVTSYILGLELDEYWNEDMVNPLGSFLNTLTQKKIGIHLLNGSYRFVEYHWVDFLVYQYGFDLSASEIELITKDVISKINGKPFVAGEYSAYDESTSIELGNAAMKAGAVGFGNGAQ